jgi:predicted MFS family arabinose efflux permease
MSFTSNRLPRVVNVIAAARGVSVLGDEVAVIAWMFRAKDLLGHWGVVAVLVAGMAPLVLLAPLAGLLVDRLRARHILIAVTCAQVAVTAALAYSNEWLMIPLIALLAAATSVVGPTWQTLVPTLVSDEQLPSAMARLQTTFSMAMMIGPFVGGLLFAEVGFQNVLFIDAGSFFCLALVPILVKRDRVPQLTNGTSKQDSMWSGLRFLGGEPVLRTMVILVSTLVLTLGVVNVVEIFFTTTVLHAGPRGYGLLGMCFGAGMLAAAVGAPTLSKRFERTELLFVATCAVLTGLIMLFALSRSIGEAGVVLVVLGAANALLSINFGVLLVRTTAHVEHLRGRIFSSVSGIVSSAQILSLALGGLLLSVWQPTTIIMLGAGASAATLVLTVTSVLRSARASLPPQLVANE